MKLMDNDLEKAEEMLADATKRANAAESKLEEVERYGIIDLFSVKL